MASYRLSGILSLLCGALLGAALFLFAWHATVHAAAPSFIAGMQAENGVEVPANVWVIIECTGTGTYPLGSEGFLDSSTLNYWIMHPTQPGRLEYFFSKARIAQKPSYKAFNTLTGFTRGKYVYIQIDQKPTDTQKITFKCGEGFSLYAPQCGDGTVNQGEQCDSGTSNGKACTAGYGQSCTYCTTSCTLKTVSAASCGDGIVQADANEQCDSGTSNGKACTPSGAYGSTCSYCSNTCTLTTVQGPRCGDNVLQAFNGEDCDDGNAASGDGCFNCKQEKGYLCHKDVNVCVVQPICGDGVITSWQESCDDANAMSGDGCSSSCRLEDGFACEGTPSKCTSTTPPVEEPVCTEDAHTQYQVQKSTMRSFETIVVASERGMPLYITTKGSTQYLYQPQQPNGTPNRILSINTDTGTVADMGLTTKTLLPPRVLFSRASDQETVYVTLIMPSYSAQQTLPTDPIKIVKTRMDGGNLTVENSVSIQDATFIPAQDNGHGYHQQVLSADGKTLYVLVRSATHPAAMLLRISTETMKAEAKSIIATGGKMLVDEASGTIYIAEINGMITSYNAQTLAVVRSGRTGLSGITDAAFIAGNKIAAVGHVPTLNVWFGHFQKRLQYPVMTTVFDTATMKGAPQLLSTSTVTPYIENYKEYMEDAVRPMAVKEIVGVYSNGTVLVVRLQDAFNQIVFVTLNVSTNPPTVVYETEPVTMQVTGDVYDPVYRADPQVPTAYIKVTSVIDGTVQSALRVLDLVTGNSKDILLTDLTSATSNYPYLNLPLLSASKELTLLPWSAIAPTKWRYHDQAVITFGNEQCTD